MAGAQAAMMLAAGCRGPNAITSITQISGTKSNAETISWPGGLQVGDVAVLFDFAVNSSGPLSNVVPTNFTEIGTGSNMTGPTCRYNVSYKVLDGLEAGTFAGLSGNSSNFKNLHVFRPNRPATEVLPKNPLSQLSNNDPTAQLCPSGSGDAPLIVMAAVGGSSSNFTVESPALTAKMTNAALTTLVTGYKVYASAPADHTFDCGDAGSVNLLASFYLELYGP